MSIITNRKTLQVQNSGSNIFLLSNSGKLILEEFFLEFDFDFESSLSLLVQWNDNGSLKLLGGEWGDYGFVDGDNVTLIFSGEVNGQAFSSPSSGGGSPISTTIDSLQGDLMFFPNDVVPTVLVELGGVLHPQQGNNSTIQIINNSRSKPEQIELYHNLILNNANHSRGSLIDGEVNRFVVEDTNTMTVSQVKPLIQKGNKSGGRYVLSDCTLKYAGQTGGKEVYIVIFKYFLPSYEFSDFDKPSWFAQNQCLKNTIEVLGAPEVNNPNSQITEISFNSQANTGWFNENYNQGDNDFSVDSVSIQTTSGDPLPEIDHNQTNIFSTVITGNANFIPTVEFMFEIIPPESDYKNNEFSNLENSYTSYFNANTVFVGNPNPQRFIFSKNNGQVLNSNESINISTPNQISISIELTPNSDFANYINSLNESDRRYRVVATVQSVGGDTNDNNAVPLILKEGILTKAPIPDQPFDGVKELGFLNHVQDISTGILNPTYSGRTEDDFVLKALIDLDNNDPWESIDLSVEVVKTSDGSSFDLFNRVFNITGNPNAPMVGGVIQLNFIEQLNQFLDGAGRNVITIKNTGNTGAGNYEIEFIWSIMANWRYWIANSSAFQDFYDNTIPNNGKNQEWVRYLELSGYTLRARVRLIKDQIAYYFGGDIDLKDYDDWDGTTTHYLFDSSGTPVSALVSGQELLFRADHVLDSGSWDASDIWGCLAIRGKEKDPRKQISTFWDWTNQNNPLKPKTGQTKATIEILTTNSTDDTARVECLIDTSLVSDTQNTLVSRIQSPVIPECVHPITYLFNALNSYVPNGSNSSDYIQVLDILLGGGDLSGTNTCCPTCGVLYGEEGFEYTTYAFGKESILQNVYQQSTEQKDEPPVFYCCLDTYIAPSGEGCDDWFDYSLRVNELIGSATGDLESLFNLDPSQFNSYEDTFEINLIKEGLDNMTNDGVVRYAIIEYLLNNGLVIKCYLDGRKTITTIL